MKKNIKKIISIAEELDWKCDRSLRNTGDPSKGYELEFEKYSPAGEDFFFTVDEDEDTAQAIAEYARDFDRDEHVRMWIGAGDSGVSGVPDIETLVEDAKAIQAMLEELAESVMA